VKLHHLIILSFAVPALAAGCRGTATLQPVPVEPELAPVRMLVLAAPAAAICADGPDLLVLEASGARVLRFDSTFAAVETIPLTERVVGPRGIAADRFYVYVHDDRTLYRLLKDNPVRVTWMHGVRPVGLAAYAPGEMLISDGERAAIWHKALFSESRRFLDAAELARPGALAALPEGMFAALSGGTGVARFNRAGIVVSRQELAEPVDLMAADRQGGLYLARSGRPEVIHLPSDGRGFRYGFGAGPEPAGLAALPAGIAVLDRDARVLLYRLP